jgi:hypothetical protein
MTPVIYTKLTKERKGLPDAIEQKNGLGEGLLAIRRKPL